MPIFRRNNIPYYGTNYFVREELTTNIKDLLREEIYSRLNDMSELNASSEEYGAMATNVATLMDREIEFEKIKEDRKDRLIKNILTGASIGLPIIAGLVMGFASMNFEREDTVTTEAGKSSIRQLLRFK